MQLIGGVDDHDVGRLLRHLLLIEAAEIEAGADHAAAELEQYTNGRLSVIESRFRFITQDHYAHSSIGTRMTRRVKRKCAESTRGRSRCLRVYLEANHP
ncbi:MAG: hypothetical protein Tsb0020_05860 [Haliangiales bacterium]